MRHPETVAKPYKLQAVRDSKPTAALATASAESWHGVSIIVRPAAMWTTIWVQKTSTAVRPMRDGHFEIVGAIVQQLTTP
jgi:hypothetical protein